MRKHAFPALSVAVMLASLAGCAEEQKEPQRPAAEGNPHISRRNSAEPGIKTESPSGLSEDLKASGVQPSLPPTERRSETRRPPASVRSERPAGGRPASLPPNLPDADEKAGHSYEIGSTRIDVVGVCRITESDVECWDPKGSPDTALKDRVRTALVENASYPRHMQFIYGKKNRVVIVRTRRMIIQGAKGPHFNVHVQSIGDPGSFSGIGFGLNLPDRGTQQSGPEGFQEELQARGCAAELNEKTTSARLSVVETLRGTCEIALKQGSKGSAEGKTIEIGKIAKSVQPSYGPSGNQDAWEVELKESGGPSRVSFNAIPIDEKGAQIVFVDMNGKPVSSDEYQREMRKQSEEYQARMRANSGRPTSMPIQPKYTHVSSHTFRTQQGPAKLRLGVDPKYVAKLKFYFQKTRTVDLTGISLDPKGS